MPRRLYKIAVVTSLVLFVVVMGCWVHSRFYYTLVSLGSIGDVETINITHRYGTIIFWTRDEGYVTGRMYSQEEARFGIVPPEGVGDTVWVGLRYKWDTFEKYIIIPHWLLAILTLILPVVWLVRRRRKRDPDAVPCAKCGYDMRGSPDGACPECGEG